MSKKATTKPAVRTGRNTLGKTEIGAMEVAPDACVSPMADYSCGFEHGRDYALYDSPAERLKRLQAEVADLTEAIAEHSAALSECEIKRENRLSAIRRIGTSLGF